MKKKILVVLLVVATGASALLPRSLAESFMIRPTITTRFFGTSSCNSNSSRLKNSYSQLVTPVQPSLGAWRKNLRNMPAGIAPSFRQWRNTAAANTLRQIPDMADRRQHRTAQHGLPAGHHGSSFPTIKIILGR